MCSSVESRINYNTKKIYTICSDLVTYILQKKYIMCAFVYEIKLTYLERMNICYSRETLELNFVFASEQFSGASKFNKFSLNLQPSHLLVRNEV